LGRHASDSDFELYCENQEGFVSAQESAREERAPARAPNPEARRFVAISISVEYASDRKIRDRNKLYYRFNHWPIWIFVFSSRRGR